MIIIMLTFIITNIYVILDTLLFDEMKIFNIHSI